MTSAEPGGPSTTEDPAVAPLRPRYGRLTAFGAAVLVTLVSMLGGLGILPTGPSASYAAAPDDTATLQSAPEADESDQTTDSADAGDLVGRGAADPAPPEGGSTGDLPVPVDSGTGKRVVFSISQQRVWLVRGDETVKRSYPVSGSIYDNLAPGVYQVYSKSKDAIGVDDSGTMHYMVRFAHGENAAIGFHDIPVAHGKLVQTRDELGTPLSHGCVRQWRPDAKALWRFAPLGTQVDVQA